LGQGASLGLVTVSLLLVSACSGDSSVDFDPVTNPQDGGSGGSDSNHDGNAAKAGTASGGSGTQAGSGHAGNETSAGAGGADGGNDTGGTTAAGKGGTGNGGKAGSGGSANGGKGGTDSGGGKGGKGGTDAGGGKGGTDTGGTAGGGKGGSAGGGAGGAGGKGGSAGGGAGGKGGGGSGGADGGGCTSGTFGNSAYYFCGIVDSAALAAQKCESLGMTLITIQSPEENAFVAGKIKSSAWLGGSDALKEGDWYWLDQTLFTQDSKPVDAVYSNWAEGQPNNNGASGASENCVALLPAGVSITSAKWNDLACDLTGMRAACEGPLK
jgi:hypothetical protein